MSRPWGSLLKCSFPATLTSNSGQNFGFYVGHDPAVCNLVPQLQNQLRVSKKHLNFASEVLHLMGYRGIPKLGD